MNRSRLCTIPITIKEPKVPKNSSAMTRVHSLTLNLRGNIKFDLIHESTKNFVEMIIIFTSQGVRKTWNQWQHCRHKYCPCLHCQHNLWCLLYKWQMLKCNYAIRINKSSWYIYQTEQFFWKSSKQKLWSSNIKYDMAVQWWRCCLQQHIIHCTAVHTDQLNCTGQFMRKYRLIMNKTYNRCGKKW